MNFSDCTFEYDTGHSGEDCGQRIVSFTERTVPKVKLYLCKLQLEERCLWHETIRHNGKYHILHDIFLINA